MRGIIDRFMNWKERFWRSINTPNTVPLTEHDGVWPEDMMHEDTGREPHPDFEQEIQDAPRRKSKESRRAHNSKVVEMYGRQYTDSRSPEVVIRHPADLAQAANVGESIIANKMCVVDLSKVDRPMMQRIADFLFGMCYAVNGSIERISDYIFIIVPEGVRITNDVREELERDGYPFPIAHH